MYVNLQMETGCAALEESLRILLITHGSASPLVDGLQKLLLNSKENLHSPDQM